MVLDFAILRQELWDKALSSGVQLLLGWSIQFVVSLRRSTVVKLVNAEGQTQI